jgi:hypothetical protein
MTYLNKFFIIFVTLFLLSCVSVKKSIIPNNKILTLPGGKNHLVIGSIKISNLYFDPLETKSAFKKASQKALNSIAPDALYDLGGDICWISDFNVNTRSLKCLGLCTEINFNLFALKQR